MAYPKVIHTSYPPPVNVYIEQAVRPFIASCLESCAVVMKVLNDKLGLPEKTLYDLHRPEKRCQSESRCIKVPPVKQATAIALGAHTDFGRCARMINSTHVPHDLSLSNFLVQSFFPREPSWRVTGSREKRLAR